jgi:hypothetical protein
VSAERAPEAARAGGERAEKELAAQRTSLGEDLQ